MNIISFIMSNTKENNTVIPPSSNLEGWGCSQNEVTAFPALGIDTLNAPNHYLSDLSDLSAKQREIPNPRFQLSWCKFQCFTDCYGSDHRLNHQGENACRQTLRCKGNQTLINLINTHETSRIEGSQVDTCKGCKMYICDVEHALTVVKARRKRQFDRVEGTEIAQISEVIVNNPSFKTKILWKQMFEWMKI